MAYSIEDIRSLSIGLEIRDRGTSYWLESLELPELLENDSTEILQRELQHFETAGCAILQVP